MSKVLSNMNSAEENNKYLRSVLPTRGKLIDWKNSIGCTIEYEYDYHGKVYTGNLTIERYKPKGQKVYFKGIEKGIYAGNLQRCELGGILNLITSDFKYEVGDIVNGLLIIDREYRTITTKSRTQKCKFYKYRCTCPNEDWIEESNLNNGKGCNACCGQKPVLGINTIWDKARWMVGLGVSEEDAKKYTFRSGQKIEVICPHCGRKKKCKINDIYRNKSIGCVCNDSVSYPEKFVYSVLEQLNIKFEIQYCPKWRKDKQRYDFHLLDYNTIIETHGSQHGRFITKCELTLVKKTNKGWGRDDMKNDTEKCWLAYENGVENYIQLDCGKSDMNYIKNNILNSDLAKLFDLSKVDWLKCHEFACSNLVKKICDYWHEHREINGEDIFTKDVGEVFRLSKPTILTYLKQGTKLGWCNYDPKEEKKRKSKK